MENEQRGLWVLLHGLGVFPCIIAIASTDSFSALRQGRIEAPTVFRRK